MKFITPLAEAKEKFANLSSEFIKLFEHGTLEVKIYHRSLHFVNYYCVLDEI